MWNQDNDLLGIIGTFGGTLEFHLAASSVPVSSRASPLGCESADGGVSIRQAEQIWNIRRGDAICG